jgi:hypothetical protein
MIDNQQLGIINLGSKLFPSLMGNFDYSSPSNDIFFLTVPNQLKAAIFQVATFKTSYFEDPWNLPSPSTSMEGVWNISMAMLLSITKVAYNIV